MSRAIFAVAILALLNAAPGVRADDSERKAVRIIEQYRGRYTRDATLPGNPIVTLDLSGTGVSPRELKELAVLQHVTTLDLRGCYNLRYVVPQEVELYKNLTTLNTPSIVSEHTIGILSSLPKMTSLTLIVRDATDEQVRLLGKLRGVTALDLLYSRITEAGLKELAALSNMANLAHLTCGGDEDLRHITAFKKLTSLTVHGAISPAGLKRIGSLHELRRLGLAPSGHKLTDDGFKELAALKHLNELTISHCRGLTGVGFRHLASLPDLTVLYLPFSDLNDDCLEALAGCKKLKRLQLPDAKFTDIGAKHLASLTTLHELNISMCRVTDVGVRNLTTLKQLGMLSLAGTQVTDDCIGDVATLTNLTSLYLGETAVTDAGLEKLAPLEKLTFVEPGRTHVSDRTLQVLRAAGLLHALPNATTATGVRPISPDEVTSFGLHDAITDAGLKEIGIFNNLTRLYLPPKITDTGLKELTNLKHLTHLSVKHTAVTDKGLKTLPELPNLAVLGLDPTKVTDDTLILLRERKWLDAGANGLHIPDVRWKVGEPLPELVELDLRGSRVTDPGLKSLADLKRLGTLYLNTTLIRGTGLKDLAHLPNFTALYLEGTDFSDANAKDVANVKTLRLVQLNNTKVTNVGLRELVALPNLTKLLLSDTRVSDAGLKTLANCKQLRSLHLVRCNEITDAGVKEFQLALPNCQVFR